MSFVRVRQWLVRGGVVAGLVLALAGCGGGSSPGVAGVAEPRAAAVSSSEQAVMAEGARLNAAELQRAANGEDTAPTKAATDLAPKVAAAAEDVGADDSALAPLRAVGLVAEPCGGPLPAGTVTGLAGDGIDVVVAIDGGVQVLGDDAGCGFGGADVLVPAGSGREHVAAVAGVVVSAGPAGAEVLVPSGATVACPVITGPVAVNGDQVALAWDAGRVARVELTTDGCAQVEDDVYPDLEVVVASFVSTNTVVIGAVADGTASVSRFNRRRTDWTTPLPTGGIDALTACGDGVCVLDSSAGQVHVVDTDGSIVGSVTVDAIAPDLATPTAVALAATTDGSLVVAVVDGSNSTQLVRVGTQRG